MIKNKKFRRGEPLVSIVFLNWNGKNETFELIDSLKKINYSNYRIIIVDNGSTDGSIGEFDKKYKNFATIIKNKKNFGEAEGLNVGIRMALEKESDYILIMDNDMEVDKNFLKKLVGVMETYSNAGVAGPKIYYSNPRDVIWSAGCDYHFRGFRSRYQNEKDVGQAEKKEKVAAVDCVMLMRSDVLKKCGLLNSEFFTMHEMTGWCLKISKEGWESIYVPESKVWHKVSTFWNKDKKKMERTTYYDIRNWLLLNKEHESRLYFLWILFLESTIFFIIRLQRYVLEGNFEIIKTYFIAIWHALTNKTPMKLYPYN